MSNETLYIHETIQISVRHRKEYLDHFCSWDSTTRRLYDMRCLGVWATVGSTDMWPEAIVMWELDGLDALTRMLSGEFAFLQSENAEIPDHYELFWGGAPEGVTATSGYDRVLLPHAQSPTLESALESGVSGIGYYHEFARVRPGRAPEFLELYDARWRPFLEGLGMRLVGSYRTLLKNDSETLAVWALPEWSCWAALERALATAPEARDWRERCAPFELDWDAKLLTPAANSPLDAARRALDFCSH
ncbi:MAG: NIPSNAP family protein [Deltaproteobacteria bacterium]|jgi:hypothetical protein|nr:NIPSNAP family protein [Deltaproteobacteria bacterium]MBW2495899.1 NIPSNAP family protein [Deltaproteobacteria bacterium]